MSKLQRRGYLAISTIAAASALLVAAPAGASAAEESGGSSTSGQTVAEPSGNATQPAATEWTPQGVEGGTSGGGAAPLEHGSSVGSGVVTGKAGSDPEPPSYTPESAPSYTPESGGSYEPEPSTGSTTDEPASTPRAESGVQPAQPPVTAKVTRPARAVDVAVGTAMPRGHSGSPQADGVGSAPPVAAAPFANPGDQAASGSPVLPLLAVIVLGLVLGYAFVRLRRHRQRQRLEALWRQQNAEWEAALRGADLRQAPPASKLSANPLQQINVG
jgi:hypothetical protein